MQYAELIAKTNFTFLTGASSPEELIVRAAELKIQALAITDHDGVYGIPRAYWQKKNLPNLKLITGASLSLENNPRLILLAKTKAAYGVLCRILTASHAKKKKGQALLSQKEFLHFLSLPGAKDLIAIASLEANFSFLCPIVPNLYVSLSRYLDGFDAQRTEQALQIRQKWGTKIVATNDVHYHLKERKKLQDALTAIRELTPLQKLGHKLFSNAERQLKSPEEMLHLFRDLPEAIPATMEIADQCSFCPSELRYRYPGEWIPENHTSQSYLEELTLQGARKRYPNGVPEKVLAQLKYELKLIAQLNYPDYFLTIYDIVDFANRKNILCQGRGSAANSIVCYCLGITAIDPIHMDLLFERFISLERNEPPDIDVDFEHERREEVIQYVYEKYGRDRAGMVSAVVTYRKRSAFRELSKALGLNVGVLSAKNLAKVFDEKASTTEVKNAAEHVEELAEEMAGFPRHLSIHSGGFTLSADPIIDIVPVEPARMEGRTIIQWDKCDLDYLGLLKIDLLSLGMLTALHRTLDLVGKSLYQLPVDDEKTYKMIQQGDTVGTFQIESRAQISMLGRLLPKNFYDLVIQVAIVRPGPIMGKMVHPYLNRRRGLEAIEYPHPKLKTILHKTLGVPLFQEQVMKMAVELGGFTPGESDELRRAIGAWRSQGSIDKMGKKLTEGLRRSGLSEEFSNKVFQQIQGFAQYGFPESHAASFALLAYASCYLKCHHPGEFTCGLLNSQPMGFYAAHTLVNDAKRHGVEVLAIHPNHSEWECTMRASKLQLGWKVVHGIHRREIDNLLSQRPFHSLENFLRKTSLRKDALFRLAMGGSFEIFGLEPRQALWQILDFHHKREATQGDFFLDLEYKQSTSKNSFSSLTDFERIREQYAAFRLATHGHPMSALRKNMRLSKLNTITAKKLSPGSSVTIAGLMLVRQRPPTAKGMTFSTLEDEFGYLDIAIAPNNWERLKPIFLEHCFLEIRGKLQKETNSYSLLVSNLRPLWKTEALSIEPTQYFH